MRERTTWDRTKIANQLKKIAEDPRAMNQDHLEQQPAADAYDIGGPSEFAEDVHPPDGSWKAEQGSDGNTERNEIGQPEFRSETFTASLSPEEVQKKAHLCTKVARVMLPKTASEQAIEDQAVALMDLPTPSLQDTLTRLASDDDADDDNEGQDKEAGEVPPQFKENIEKMKEKAKDKADEGDDKGQDKGQDKEAAQQQQAQGQDDKQGQDQEEGQDKEAGQQQTQGQDDKQSQDQEEGQDKEASKSADDDDEDEEVQEMVKEAATQLLAIPEGEARTAAMKAVASPIFHIKKKKRAEMDQQAMQQLMGQVQDMVQQACQNMAQQQQQGQEQLMGQDDQQLIDQMLSDDYGQQQQQMQVLAESDIQMDTPNMDVGDASLTADDAVLSQIFASGSEVIQAMEANNIQGLPNPVTASQAPAQTMSRTASRQVGTQPSAGVSKLGGATAPSQGSDDVNNLSSLWKTDPDVSGVF